MSIKNISVLVGSLRKDSFNKKVANEIINIAPDGLAMEIIEIDQLPFYNEDLDHGNPPSEWSEFRKKIKDSDGFLFLTPEYNRSVSGVLKNAIDVASRPYGQSAWGGKPGAVISVSMSSLGAFGANHHLRQSMVFLDVPMMQQPEAYVGSAHELFDDSGNLVPDTQAFLQSFIDAYAKWVEKCSSGN